MLLLHLTGASEEICHFTPFPNCQRTNSAENGAPERPKPFSRSNGPVKAGPLSAFSDGDRRPTGGDNRARTGNLRRARAALSPLSYIPGITMPGRARSARSCRLAAPKLVGLDRLELSTSPLSGVRSSQLSYRPSRAQSWLHVSKIHKKKPATGAGWRPKGAATTGHLASYQCLI